MHHAGPPRPRATGPGVRGDPWGCVGLRRAGLLVQARRRTAESRETGSALGEREMFGRLGWVLRGRASAALAHSGCWRKVGLGAGVGGIAGAVLGVGSHPARAQEVAATTSWRFTAPAAETRARRMSNQEGFKEPPIVVTISGAAGQIAYSA